MSLQTIRDNAYAMLNIPAADQTNFDTLALACLNQIRLKAERDCDFVLSKRLAYLTVVASDGSALSSAQTSFSSEAPSGSTVAMKTVDRVEARIDATWVPVRLLTNESQKAREDRYIYQNSYPSSETAFEITPPSSDNTQSGLVVYWHGGTFYTNSADNVVIRIFGSSWLTAYSVIGAAADFMITYAEDFMMWALVIALNHRTNTFIPRQEGSLDLSSPLAMRDQAWESLVLWNSHMHASMQDIVSPG